jgi:2-methylcitrate dehydratase PrpD
MACAPPTSVSSAARMCRAAPADEEHHHLTDNDATPSATLASWAATVRPDDIPDRIRERTSQLITDAVGSALAGRHSAEVAQIDAVAAHLAPGADASVIGGGRSSRLGATLRNAYEITALTVCDVYRPNHMHVTPEVLPPALAVAEGRGVTGADFLTAVAAGLEVTVRIARAIDYAAFRARGWHSPGILGPFGGAVSAGRLLKLDEERMRWALGLAGSQAAGTFAQWGTPTVKFHQARGAVSGLLAASMAAQGFRSSDEILAHPDGGLFTTYVADADVDAVCAGLGEEWELERISMRLWPMASLIQGVISGVFDLVTEHDLLPDQVRRLRIGLAGSTHRMHGEIGWEDRFRALLSTRWSAAVVLHDRECWVEQFDPARLTDPVVSDFARNRIEVVVDDSLPTVGATVEADLVDGGTVSVRRDFPKGDTADPLTFDEIVAKFRRGAQGVIEDGDAERALAILGVLDELHDIDELMLTLGHGRA